METLAMDKSTIGEREETKGRQKRMHAIAPLILPSFFHHLSCVLHILLISNTIYTYLLNIFFNKIIYQEFI